jgi:hypothetical protein
MVTYGTSMVQQYIQAHNNNNGSPSFGTNRTYQFSWEFRDEEKENGREEITESSLESLRVIRQGTIILLN